MFIVPEGLFIVVPQFQVVIVPIIVPASFFRLASAAFDPNNPIKKPFCPNPICKSEGKKGENRSRSDERNRIEKFSHARFRSKIADVITVLRFFSSWTAQQLAVILFKLTIYSEVMSAK